ncbi:RDD family protein [Carboxylicivirga sediminis]|uniref:RDD family protein n=1 Tax=Carboxylicivirga sediminis TaxID=2006564 RepID=A0A941F7C7_9BACT|nr:RDD family protein [Carboxylicivirga sediminis]MBR8538271.1 RDD family protein [Carboxylicivirga sediminis]
MTKEGKLQIGRINFFTERLLAGVVDGSIVLGLSLFPRIGWLFGLIYFLFKDSLPLLNGQSFGRRLFKIKVINKADGTGLMKSPDKALIRQIIFLVPVLNLLELYRFFTKSERFGDTWTDTTVVRS